MTRRNVVILIGLAGLACSSGLAQPVPKAHVADAIRKVEDGVDAFRDYLKRRGENAESAASSARSRSRRGSTGSTEARKAQADETKVRLDDNLNALNRSTNRLRRKFDATDTWMETKPMVERVVDDGRTINQTVARGNYGSEVARLWAILRKQMNELARIYAVPPLGI